MRADMPKSCVGAVPRACPASLALGLAALLLGAFLMLAEPSGAQVPLGAPRLATMRYQPEGTPTVTPTCPTVWSVVPSPNAGSASNYLNGIAALSANDIWVVGNYDNGGTYQALIEHWDGTGWSVVPSPSVGSTLYNLNGIAAVSANDVWAVGYYDNRIDPALTLVEHWNGSSWNMVPSPNVGTLGNTLAGIAAVSANDIWAVGDYSNTDGLVQTLIEHWNGSSWSVVSNPNSGAHTNFLNGVAAVSAGDAWAVGYYNNGGPNQVLIERWNGSSWNVVLSPNPGTSINILNGVAALSANDIWAVGSYYNSGSGSYQTLIEHWSGSSWSVVPSPNIDSASNHLNRVAAASARDVWAAGYFDNGSGTQTLVVHWDGSSWSVVPSPNPGTYGRNFLNGVAAVSAGDAWAVGSADDYALMERWNGSSWSIVPSPNIYTGGNYLNGVAALSSNDIWAVGTYYSSGPQRTLIEHWDGNSWSVIPSPNPGTQSNALNGVAAVSPDDVWAVGSYYNSGPEQLLVEHWDGSSWNVIPGPRPGPGNCSFREVAAVSANDIWAVGSYHNSGPQRTLVEHWEGGSWSIVPSPNSGTGDNFLNGVAAVSANDVWAVGSYGTSNGNSDRNNRSPAWTLIEHWDGNRWSVIPSPNPGTFESGLNGVAVASASDVWAVGSYDDSNAPYQTLVEHWDGGNWSVIPSPNVGPTSDYLKGVSVESANDVWAVGYYWNSNDVAETLVEHWDGSGWGVVPGPSPGLSRNYLNGIAAVSASDVWAVGDYTNATVSQTLVERYSDFPFTDVHTSDYFYQAARYLYCRGAISGYADYTFRPYNLSTRGQFCKVIVLAEGWDIYTPPTPTFQDVPASHPFYRYIETAYNHSIISGYSCSAGCLEFRPGNNVTRGQLCKIVVLAEGWTIYTPPTPTFSDVPATHTFYTFIETAYSHGIISGYTCGAGCLEFRPGNNATRGQLCKIVYQAVTQP